MHGMLCVSCARTEILARPVPQLCTNLSYKKRFKREDVTLETGHTLTHMAMAHTPRHTAHSTGRSRSMTDRDDSERCAEVLIYTCTPYGLTEPPGCVYLYLYSSSMS